MQSYRVVAIGDRIANAVRKTLRSPGYGHPAHPEVATGYGPCRRCLKSFAIGDERRILFTQRLPQDRDVAYTHVRDTDAGCYDFSIERTGDQKSIDEGVRSNGGYSHE